jgi:hypothetical protein
LGVFFVFKIQYLGKKKQHKKMSDLLCIKKSNIKGRKLKEKLERKRSLKNTYSKQTALAWEIVYFLLF